MLRRITLPWESGSATMPSRLRPLRIAAAAAIITPADIYCVMRLRLFDGAGNVAAQFVYPTYISAGVSGLQTFAVNAPGNVEAAVWQAPPVTPRVAYLPPDLWLGVGESFVADFMVAPTSIDSPLVVSFEEGEE